MFKVFGFLSIFMIFLVDDMYWFELSMVINDVSFDEVEKRGNCFDSMRKDFLFIVIYFERWFKVLIKYVINEKLKLLGEVIDYFVCVEF